MTRDENLRKASKRFGQLTEGFCRWITIVEIQVEDANSREAASALRDDLDTRWEKIMDEWQELVEAYPEEEVVDQGDEVVDQEQAELERGKYRIRMEYLTAAEAAQNRLETAIRAKVTLFNVAARTRTRDEDLERENAHTLSSNATYKTASEHWTEAQDRIHHLIARVKAGVDKAVVTPYLAEAKKFRRWIEDISRLRTSMNALTLDMIEAVPAKSGEAEVRQAEEKVAIEEELGDYVTRVEDFYNSCLQKRDELEDAQRVSELSRTPDREESVPSNGGSVQYGSGAHGGLSLEKLKCRKFSGKMQEYPRWKHVWEVQMHQRMSIKDEMIMLAESVPKAAQRELERLKTLDQVWEFLDEEYGNKRKLAAQRVADLNQFRFPAHVKTETAKALELYEIWRDVYTDLENVDREGALDGDSVVTGFITKFPDKMQDDWIKFEALPENSADPPGKVLNAFLTETRKHAQKRSIYAEVEPGTSSSTGTTAKYCNWCGGTHDGIPGRCTNPKKGSNAAAAGTSFGIGAGVNNCPICGQPHTRFQRMGTVEVFADRFTSCPVWRSMAVDDRVQWLQNTNGCVLCGDWTGSHQRDSCQSGYSGCRKCGKHAHGHGARVCNNKFAGLIHISNQVTSTKARRRT